MKNKVLSLFLISSVCFNLSCSKEEGNYTPSQPTPVAPQEEATYAEDELVIYVTNELAENLEKRIKSKSTANTFNSSELQNVNITSIKRLFAYAGKFEERTRAENLHLYYSVKLSNDTPITKAQSSLLTEEGVVMVEKKLLPAIQNNSKVASHKQLYTTSESNLFNDPMLPEQWHYINDGTQENFRKGVDINVAPVWAKGITGIPEVIVAIVDCGVDINHEDLKQNIYINEAELYGEKGVDDDRNGVVDDINGFNFVYMSGVITPEDHGSHVAGTVAAVNNNGVGVAGVAGGDGSRDSGVRLLPVQISVTDGEETDLGEITTAAEGVKYGADAGAVISQNSWGYTVGTIPSYEKAAIDYFIKYAGVDENGDQVGAIKGGIVVFSAGNANAGYANPGGYEPAVCVTAIDASGVKANYTNSGDFADITAPGGNKTKWDLEVGGVLSCLANNQYGWMTGTSMACPHVSGAIALYISKMVSEGNNEGLTADMVITKMLSSTRSLEDLDADNSNKLGKGLIDVARFCDIDYGTTPDAVTDLSVTDITDNSLLLNWTASANSNGFKIFYSTNSLNTLDPENPDSNISVIDFGNNPTVGDKVTYIIKDLGYNTNYNFAIYAWDYAGNLSPISSIVDTKTLDNYPPIFYNAEGEVLTEDNLSIIEGEKLMITYLLKDPEGKTVQCEHNKGSAGESYIYGSTTTKLMLTISTANLEVGDYCAHFTATDNVGKQSLFNVYYTVEEIAAPIKISDFEDIDIIGKGETTTLDLSSYFDCGENSSLLTYEVEINDTDILSSDINDNILTLNSLKAGITEVAVRAFNETGKSLTMSFSVTVTNKITTGEKWIIYPNPIENELNILSDSEDLGSLTIYNSLGTKVLTVNNTNNDPIDVTSLKSGVYSVVLIIDGIEEKKQILKK